MDEKPFIMTESERELLAMLRAHPNLDSAVRGVLSAAGRVDSKADEVEGDLIDATRKLGNEAICAWGSRVARRVEEEMEREEPTMHRHKKKA